jgi:hypothetical protein
MSYPPETVPKGDGGQEERGREKPLREKSLSEEQLDLLVIQEIIETARRRSSSKQPPVRGEFYIEEPPPEESIRELIGITEDNLPEIIRTIQDRIIKINFRSRVAPSIHGTVCDLSKESKQGLKHEIEVAIGSYNFNVYVLSPQEISIFIKRKKQELEKINELLDFLKKEFNPETQVQRLNRIDELIQSIDFILNLLPRYDSSLDSVGGYYDCYRPLLHLPHLNDIQDFFRSELLNRFIKHLQEVRSSIQEFLEVLQNKDQNPERYNYYYRVISEIEDAIEKRKESMRGVIQAFQTEKLVRRIILRFIFLHEVMHSVNYGVKLKGALLENGIDQRALEIISKPEIEKQIWIAVFSNPNCEIIFDWDLVRNCIRAYKERQEFSEKDIMRYKEDIRANVGIIWVVKCFVEYLQRILPENLFNRLQAPSDVLKDLEEFNLPDFVIDF